MKRHSILLLTLCAQALNTLACPFLRKESDGVVSPHRALKDKGEDKKDKDDKDDKDKDKDKDKDGGGEGGLGLCKKTSGLVVSTAEGTCSAFNFLTDHFYDYIPRADPESNEIMVARSRIQGVSVRYPFHDGAEFDKNSDDLLGPDGCVSKTPDNSNLFEADSSFMLLVEPIYQEVCDRISRADFVAMWGQMILKDALPPEASMDIDFHFGRKDKVECDIGAEHRLPETQKGFSDFQRVFETQMGLTLAEGTALMGAHSLGHVHESGRGSGFGLDASTRYDAGVDSPDSNVLINAWDRTPDVLDNDYYKQVNLVAWFQNTQLNNPEHTRWEVFNPTLPIIALNIDMSLGFNVDLAAPEFPATGVNGFNQVCGPAVDCLGVLPPLCFENLPRGCGPPENPAIADFFFNDDPLGDGIPTKGYVMPTEVQGVAYATDDDESDPGAGLREFHRDFAKAWTKMVTVGYSIDSGKDSSGLRSASKGKLGKLESIDLSKC